MNRIAVAVLLLAGCASMERHALDDEIEYGRVMQATYVPSQSYSGSGFSTSGHVVFTSGQTDPRYALVIRCPHGQFEVNSEELFRRVSQGDSVRITYHRVVDGNGVFRGYETVGLDRVQ